MKTNKLKYFQGPLLAWGYSKRSHSLTWYSKHAQNSIFKYVDLYSNEIIYRLYDQINQNSLIFITSKPKDFSKTLKDFERQCEILLTTILFSHEN